MINTMAQPLPQQGVDTKCIKKVREPRRDPVEAAHSKFVGDVRIAVTDETHREIRALRKLKYKHIYPDMDLDNDVLDRQSIVMFSRDFSGKINSTSRLVVEGEHVLPEHEFLQDYQAEGARLVEWGRFIISDGNKSLLKNHYRTVYSLAVSLGFDAIVMAMRPNHISLHRRMIGTRIVEKDMGIDYGGPYRLACVVWELQKTKAAFFKWIGD